MLISSSNSRPGSLTSVSDRQRDCYVGIDVGGSAIKIGLLDVGGQVLAFDVIPTQAQRGAEDALVRIVDGVKRLVVEAGVNSRDVACAGLATPGTFDVASGRIICSGNLAAWQGFRIRDRLQFDLGMPVTYVNDANAAAYGEHWRGGGAKYHSMILLTLGTGIGGGIVIGDVLVEGENGCGGECGHILVDPSPDAPQDARGGRGSLEAYVSSGALVSHARNEISFCGAGLLADRHAAGEDITPRMIGECAERGDGVARQVIMEAAHWLAIGIVTLAHTVDPNAIVIGGAMTFGGTKSQIGRDFLQRIREEVRTRLLEPLDAHLRIEFATLGNDAGYIGAAGVARLEHCRMADKSLSSY